MNLSKESLPINPQEKFGLVLHKSNDCGECDIQSMCDDFPTGKFKCPDGYVYKTKSTYSTSGTS